MPISFVTSSFGGRPQEEDVVSLIAAKKYARAIELLKAQLQKRGANPSLRMQLADVLMLAGKKSEAVALLLPLADQYATDGFAAKAISVLKKLQKIEPGRSDVQEKLARLIGEKQKEASLPPVAAQPERRPAVQMPGPDESILEIGFAISPISVSAGSGAAPPQPPVSQPLRTAPAAPVRAEPVLAAPALVEPALVPRIEAEPALAPAFDLEPKIAPPVRVEPPVAPPPVRVQPPVAPPPVRVQPPVAPPPVTPPSVRVERAPSPEPTRAPRVEPKPAAAQPRPAEPPRRSPAPGADTLPALPAEPMVVAEPLAPGLDVETAVPVLELEPPLAAPAKAGSEFELPPEDSELPPATVADAAALVDDGVPELPVEPGAWSPGADLAIGAELTSDPDATVAPSTLPPAGRAGDDIVLDLEPMVVAEPVPDEIPLIEPEPQDSVPLQLLDAEPEPASDTKAAHAPLAAKPDSSATAATDALRIDLDLSPVAADDEPLPAHALDASDVGIEDYDLMYEGDEDEEGVSLGAPIEPLAPESPDTPELSDGQFADELMSLVDSMFQEAPASSAAAAPAAPSRGTQIVVSPLFRDFAVDEMVAVIEGLKLLSFERSDVILREGDAGSSLYTLTSGRVRAFRRDKASGKQKPIGDLKEGAFFGEMSVLTGEPRAATIVALSRCELLELDRPTLDEITKAHPHVWDVLREFAAERAIARR